MQDNYLILINLTIKNLLIRENSTTYSTEIF